MRIASFAGLFSFIFLLVSSITQAQVGIGTTTPHASSLLEINSTNKGLLLPRMTAAERNSIANPAEGLMIFNTTSKSLNVYFSGAWQQVTNSTPSGTVSALTAGTPSGSLIRGVLANSVSSEVTYTGGNGEPHSGQTVTSTGVTGLTATLSAGTFGVGNGSLTYTITGTPATAGTASFAVSIGTKSVTLTRTVADGSISTLTTGTATNGTLTGGIVASGVSSVVSYTGGNGGAHSGQTITSTGVTGLTATLSAGSFASGNGTLTYTITGTPSAGGTASFALNIGGKTATLTRSVVAPPCGPGYTVSHYYSGNTMTYGTVVGANNKCWLDRNLGATQLATTYSNGDGDLFQWGRGDDGHQYRYSATINTQSPDDIPGNNKFILNNLNWRTTTNLNLWQGVNGINNPCPTGWRIPTQAEWQTEISSWTSQNINGALISNLKIPAAGYRSPTTGGLGDEGTRGRYWTSTTYVPTSSYVYFIDISGSSISTTTNAYPPNGYSVRCIKD